MTTVSYHLQRIQERIIQACSQASRSIDEVHLLAVSKTFNCNAIQEAINTGLNTFGENYVAEAVLKIQHFKQQHALQWHMIGPIQSNKTKDIAQNFDWVHAVDRFKIAQRLSDQRPTDLPALQVCIAVNVSGETSKSGVAPEEAIALAQQITQLPRLQLRGLMCIPKPSSLLQEQRKPFALLRSVMEDIQSKGISLDTLSMGMSNDLEAAIMEGATIIRVGSALFGARDYSR